MCVYIYTCIIYIIGQFKVREKGIPQWIIICTVKLILDFLDLLAVLCFYKRILPS